MFLYDALCPTPNYLIKLPFTYLCLLSAVFFSIRLDIASFFLEYWCHVAIGPLVADFCLLVGYSNASTRGHAEQVMDQSLQLPCIPPG
jgi:hypothetical protein